MPADGGARVQSDGRLHIERVCAPIRLLILEIFAGTWRLSVAIRQFAHIEVRGWDIIDGPEYNLLKWPTVRRLLMILESPLLSGGEHRVAP